MTTTPSEEGIANALGDVQELAQAMEREKGFTAEHDDEHQPTEWLKMIAEAHHAAYVETGYYGDRTEYRKQLLKVAHLAVSALASHDRHVAVAVQRRQDRKAADGQ